MGEQIYLYFPEVRKILKVQQLTLEQSRPNAQLPYLLRGIQPLVNYELLKLFQVSSKRRHRLISSRNPWITSGIRSLPTQNDSGRIRDAA